MFTGIVEEIGTVKSVIPDSVCGKISIKASKVLEGTRIGDSICVNGVCLTVVSFDGNGFTADVMPETLKRTNLGELKFGDPVDLERAMPSDGRFGGHIVAGHIDGTGRITEIRPDGNAVRVRITASHDILRFIIEKGSIAIDGISLTVADVTDGDFSVSLIPHTAGETILLHKRAGDKVNLENDMVGKYIWKFIRETQGGAGSSKELSMDFLAENGFI